MPFATLTYDADGRQVSETVHAAGGSARLRIYDDAGRLTNYLQYWDDDNGGWDVTGQVLTYRSDGRIAARTRTPGGTESYWGARAPREHLTLDDSIDSAVARLEQLRVALST